jgi:hypothetical protein
LNKILGFTAQKACVAALAFGLLPKCKTAQLNLTPQLLAVADAMPQQWGVIQLFIKLTGVAIIALTRTKHESSPKLPDY